MAVSLFQKILNRMFQQFVNRTGREPMTPSEWMSIQNSAVNYLNKTKGVAPGPKKPPFQGFKPEVIQGGKGIESLLESGAVKKGVAPKTKLSTLEGKKQKLDAAINKEEWIAKKHRENKEAIERFKAKTQKKTVEDFRDEGDWDPGGFAGGGLVKKFIERLFIKASNDIRQGKGKWKGLTQDQWIKQHDDLTKMMKKWEWGGKKKLPEGAEQYLGMNDLQIARAVKQAEKQVGDEKLMQKAYDEIKGGSGFTDDYKYDADVLAEEYAKQHGKVYADLPEDQISIYYDPALKRVSQDMLKRREAKKALKDVEEKIELQMFDPKDRLPNAGGGIIKFLKKFLKKKPKEDVIKPFVFPETGPHSDFFKKVLDDMLKSESRLKDFDPPKDRKPHAGGGLAYMLGEPNTRTEALQEFGVVTDPWGMYTDPSLYAQGERSSGVPGRAEYKEGGVGHGPWTMNQGARTPEQPEQNLDTPQPQVMGTPDPLKMPQGIPSAAPKSMDPRYMQQQMMRQAMMGQQQMMGQQPRMGYAGGGMGRRAFLKMMAGVAAFPFLGRGAKEVVKEAPTAIKAAETVIERGADGIPKYAFDLIEVVKAKGTKEIIEGFARNTPVQKKYTYKGVEVIEDGTGGTSVRKEHTGPAHWVDEAGEGQADEGITREVGFEIKEGGYEQIGNPQFDDAAKSVKLDDEYFEATVRPDSEGKLKDVEEGIDELDHLDLKKIADEAKTLPIRTKKAGGGPVDTQQLIQMYMEEGLSYEEAVQAAQAASNLDMNLLKRASGGLAHMLGE